MANVNSSVEVILTKEEKELLEKAIKKIEDISIDCCNSDLYLDEDGVFFNLLQNYRWHEGKLSTIVDMSE